jgi:hypothetical protein
MCPKGEGSVAEWRPSTTSTSSSISSLASFILGVVIRSSPQRQTTIISDLGYGRANSTEKVRGAFYQRPSCSLSSRAVTRAPLRERWCMRAEITHYARIASATIAFAQKYADATGA